MVGLLVPASASSEEQTSAAHRADAGASTNAAGTSAQPSGIPGSVTLQPITVGTTDGNVSAVEGIEPGTVVAADSFNKLTDGAKVIIRPSGTGAGKGGHHQRNSPPQ